MTLILFAVLFAGVLQGIILAVLLVRKQENRLSNRILAGLVTVLVFHLSLVAIDSRDLFIRIPHLSRLSWLIPLLYGPLLLLFTQSIMNRGFRIRPVHGLYLLPFLVYLALLMPYYLQSPAEKLAVLTNPVLLARADFGMYNNVTNYIHLSFTAVCLYIYYSKKRILPDYFADPGRASFAWLKTFLWGIGLIMLYSWLCFMARRYDWPGLAALYPSNFLLAVALIYWISYKLLLNPYRWDQPAEGPGKEIAQDIIKEPVRQPEITQVKYQKTALAATEISSIREKLITFIEKEKPFLDPGLAIDGLAAQLNVKRHHLSQVINQEFGQNFFEFINKYRVAEFKKQVKQSDKAHLSILGLAFDCGFNSKAAFNQVFKKQEGITPSAFVKQVKEENTRQV
jgi:AraC-like DNA-binding protein